MDFFTMYQDLAIDALTIDQAEIQAFIFILTALLVFTATCGLLPELEDDYNLLQFPVEDDSQITTSVHKSLFDAFNLSGLLLTSCTEAVSQWTGQHNIWRSASRVDLDFLVIFGIITLPWLLSFHALEDEEVEESVAAAVLICLGGRRMLNKPVPAAMDEESRDKATEEHTSTFIDTAGELESEKALNISLVKQLHAANEEAGRYFRLLMSELKSSQELAAVVDEANAIVIQYFDALMEQRDQRLELEERLETYKKMTELQSDKLMVANAQLREYARKIDGEDEDSIASADAREDDNMVTGCSTGCGTSSVESVQEESEAPQTITDDVDELFSSTPQSEIGDPTEDTQEEHEIPPTTTEGVDELVSSTPDIDGPLEIVPENAEHLAGTDSQIKDDEPGSEPENTDEDNDNDNEDNDDEHDEDSAAAGGHTYPSSENQPDDAPLGQRTRYRPVKVERPPLSKQELECHRLDEEADDHDMAWVYFERAERGKAKKAGKKEEQKKISAECQATTTTAKKQAAATEVEQDTLTQSAPAAPPAEKSQNRRVRQRQAKREAKALTGPETDTSAQSMQVAPSLPSPRGEDRVVTTLYQRQRQARREAAKALTEAEQEVSAQSKQVAPAPASPPAEEHPVATYYERQVQAQRASQPSLHHPNRRWTSHRVAEGVSTEQANRQIRAMERIMQNASSIEKLREHRSMDRKAEDYYSAERRAAEQGQQQLSATASTYLPARNNASYMAGQARQNAEPHTGGQYGGRVSMGRYQTNQYQGEYTRYQGEHHPMNHQGGISQYQGSNGSYQPANNQSVNSQDGFNQYPSYYQSTYNHPGNYQGQRDSIQYPVHHQPMNSQTGNLQGAFSQNQSFSQPAYNQAGDSQEGWHQYYQHPNNQVGDDQGNQYQNYPQATYNQAQEGPDRYQGHYQGGDYQGDNYRGGYNQGGYYQETWDQGRNQRWQ